MKYYGNELYHYGTKGQKWGVRNYQNKDGSYTAKGAAENGGAGRYSDGEVSANIRKKKTVNNTTEVQTKNRASNDESHEKLKTAAKVGIAIAGTALAAYGAYKMSGAIKDAAYRKSFEKGEKLAKYALRNATADKVVVTAKGEWYVKGYNGTLAKGVSHLGDRATSNAAHEAFRNVNKNADIKYLKDLDAARANAKEVSSSTMRAIKYLRKGY